MKSKLMLSVGMGAWVVLGMMASGCSKTPKPVKVVIIVHNGHWGYYTGATWCDFYNNYCGTGLNYGISNDGDYWNNQPVDTGGGSNNGGTNNSGTNNGSNTGGNTGGGYNNGSSNTGSNNGSNNGSDTGGGYNNGSYNNGSNNGSNTGGGYNNGSSNGTNTSGNNSGGYNNGSYNNGGSNNGSYNNSSNNGSDYGYSVGGGTYDVQLQAAQLQAANVEDRAQAVASQFQMEVESARQLVQISDKMDRMTAQGQLTDEDRDALAHAALSVAKISEDDVKKTMARAANGEKNAYDDLLAKGAANLGTTKATLRDQILPSLGISLGQ